MVASTVQVPIKFSFIGRLSASPGFHYVKIAHRLKDNREVAIESGQELYERTFFNQVKNETDSTVYFSGEKSLNDGKSFTRLGSFYIRFDMVGNIGQKPKFLERISYLDFLQVSKVPFYELSLQYISGMNMLLNCNINLSDEIGVSFTRLSKNNTLSGNWMPESKFWFGLNYRANF